MNALVVFHGHGAGPFARLFGRPGFRHCFAVVRDKRGYWISFDARSGRPVLEVAGGPAHDLARFYGQQGFAVAPVATPDPVPAAGFRWPWMSATCVGAVKKIIGVKNPLVLTPKQLFRYLRKGN